ncbi:hypothetical protein FRACA_1030004 [Frankia canadensis]|uniref:Uncharacterized protein n=1 Tax=Frankia canadensis TaxID=1836972 RepID=A0A2I2KIT9_9ACTN|nr:hypothetical protein FRACA_1030004 [Frankia canadensis]SOU52860.1 hypothetical protein FRACA_1030004 [Frankia canadensis]
MAEDGRAGTGGCLVDRGRPDERLVEHQSGERVIRIAAGTHSFAARLVVAGVIVGRSLVAGPRYLCAVLCAGTGRTTVGFVGWDASGGARRGPGGRQLGGDLVGHGCVDLALSSKSSVPTAPPATGA